MHLSTCKPMFSETSYKSLPFICLSLLLLIPGSGQTQSSDQSGKRTTDTASIPIAVEDGPSSRSAPAAKCDPSSLFSGFRFSAGDVAEAIKRGRELEKKGKPITDIYRNATSNPKWVKGNKGYVHESATVFLGIGANDIARKAYEAQRLYQPLDIPDGTLNNGFFLNELAFQVHLVSDPKFGQKDGGVGNFLQQLGKAFDPKNAPIYDSRTKPDEFLRGADPKKVYKKVMVWSIA